MGKTDLFIYGTLKNDAYVRIITGKSFRRDKAVLPDYRRVTPAGGFPYIKPLSGVFANGHVLWGIDDDSLKKLDDYEDEGNLYHRITVDFWVGDKKVSGQTYVGNVETLKRYYHSKINAERRVEKHLEAKAEKILHEEVIERGLLDLIGLNTRMLKELSGQTVESVILAALEGVRPPDYVALDEMRKERVPSLKKLKKKPDVNRYADAYISFAVRHMIFNQIEEKVSEDFRNEIYVSDQFYIHAISNLVSLQFMNKHRQEIAGMMEMCGIDRIDGAKDYEEFTKLAIMISDTVYNKELFEFLLHQVFENRNPGWLPLGAEIEMSNCGSVAPDANTGDDPVFDNFYYFHDFDLDRRTWKLGGYVDDHSYKTGKKNAFQRVSGICFRKIQNNWGFIKTYYPGPMGFIRNDKFRFGVFRSKAA